MIRKLFICAIVLFSFSCKIERKQSLINIDSLVKIKDSLLTVISSEEDQVGLLQLSLQSMNNCKYKEAIQNFNNLKSKYPYSILNKIINDNINYCNNMMDTISSRDSIKTEIQIQAEKETGVKILPVKTYWREGKPGLKLVLKNISKKEIPKLKVEIQFIDEVNNLIFSKGNYLLESGLSVDQSIYANIIGNNKYEFSSNNVIAKIFIQSSGQFIYYIEITIKTSSQLKNWRPNFKSKK